MATFKLSISHKGIFASRAFVLLKWLSCLSLIATAQLSWALYTVISNGVVTVVGTGSLTLGTGPAGMVMDLQGNVYVADTTNSQIIKISASGTSTSVLSITGLSPALSSPKGLAIDSSGNLYIADTGNSRIVEVSTSGSGSVISTPTVTLNAPQDVAVDGSGNIYISNTGNNQIVKVPAGGGNASADLTGSLASPRGIAVDHSGNLYVADTGNSRIVKVNATSPFSSGIINATVTTAAGVALNAPSGVWVGNNGILYIADTNTTEYGHPTPGRVVIVDSQGNASEMLTGNPVFNSPLALTVTAMGSIYVLDSGGTSNAGRVQSFQSYTIDTSNTFTSSVAFGHVQLGSAGTSISIPFSVNSISTLSSINVYTSGTQNLDFTIANDSTCAAAVNNTNCTVDVTFNPTAAGLRRGDLVLNYTSTVGSPTGSLTVPIFGIADAPLAALSPGIASVVNVGSGSITTPFQEVIDGVGNIYVASYSSNHVIAIPAGGGSATNVNTGSYTPSQPTGLALDAAGNLFIADYGNARIIKVATSGTASLFTISGLSTNISFPTALAFDGAGNLYITDYGNGRMVEVNPYGQGTVLATGSYTFSSINITGTAVDSVGNVYIADRNNNRVVEVNPLGSASVVSLPSLTLSSPQGVAVDPSNNLYIMDSGHQRIIQVTTSGVVTVMSFSGVTIGSTIFGITPDANDNILVGDWQNNRLVKINVGQSALTFASTNTNATSSDSPKTATVTNLGDQSLVFSANPAFATDFTDNTGDTNPCISGTSLLTGTNCDVSIKFTPLAAGSLSETITVTDNTLNVANSTQQIAVSGTGINAGDTTATSVSFSPTAAAYGQGIAITAAVTDTSTGHGSTIPTGSVTFTDTVGTTVTSLNNGAAITLNSSGTAVLTNVVLLGLGSHSITATYGGVSSTFLSSNNSGTVVLSKASVMVTGPATQPVSVGNGQTASVPVSVAGAYSGGSAPSGSISYSIVNSSNVSVSSGTATLAASASGASATIPIPSTLASGSYNISINYSGDPNYQSTTSAVLVALTVGPAASTVTLASSSNPAPAFSPVTFTATITGNGGTPTGSVNFYDGATLLGVGTVGSTGVASYTAPALGGGSHSITATYSGDTHFNGGTSSAVTQVMQQLTATTSLTSSPNPAPVYGGVTFTAAVTSSASTTATGSVSFYDGTTLLGTVTLSAGHASFTTTSLAVGTHSITVAYSGDSNFLAGTSSAVSLVVQPTAATVSLASSPNPAPAFGAVTFTATITASSGTPTGTVSFYDGTTLLGTVSVSAGHASYTTAALSIGTHAITAAYSGDSNFQASSSAAVTQVVQAMAATTTLTSSLNPSLLTSAVTFTSTTSYPSGTPTGSVAFFDGTTLLGTVTLASGQASYTTAGLAVGTHSITAVYSGDATFQGGSSAALSQVVQDFTLSNPTSGTTNTPSATVVPGGTATYTLSFGPSVGTVFPAPVTLSLSGLPPGATGTLTPSTLPAGSSLTAVTLTIQLPSTAAAVPRSFGWVTPTLALILLPFAGRMRRGGRALQRCGLMLLLLIAGVGATAGLMGCGARNTGYFGQAEQTYHVVITATSGPLSHSTTVTLTVQ